MSAPSAREGDQRGRLSRSLSEWAAAHEEAWPFSGEFETLLRGTFARATKTYDAGLLLTANGYSPQAAMLSRSLFEDMLIAFWVVYVRPEDWTVRRFNDRVAFERLTGRDLMDSLGWEVQPAEEIPAAARARLEADRPRYEALFGKFAGRSWWAGDARQRETNDGGMEWVPDGRARTLLVLVRQLDAASRGEDEQRDMVVGLADAGGGWSPLRRTYELINDFNNRLLHHSPKGVALHTQGTDGGRPGTWNVEPSVQWLRQASFALCWIYGQLLVLMCQRLAPSLTGEADEVVASALARFSGR